MRSIVERSADFATARVSVLTVGVIVSVTVTVSVRELAANDGTGSGTPGIQP